MFRLNGYASGIAVMLWALMSTATAASSFRTCPPPSAFDFHFPEGTFEMAGWPIDDAAERDPRIRERLHELRLLQRRHGASAWYSRELAAMSEPSLSCGEPAEQYRFLWLRSFHNAVVVRVHRDGRGWRVVAVENGRSQGRQPSAMPVRSRSSWIPETKFAAAREKVRSVLAADAVEDLEMRGEDGAMWIFEGVDADGWAVSERWTPRSGAHREAGLAMLALAGWSHGENY